MNVLPNPSLRASAPADGRQTWADLCRVLAIFGVVVIHAGGPFFYQFGKLPEATWLVANLFESVTRCSVPLFVMLSGALLLRGDGQPSLREVGRRVLRVLVPLVVWNIAYLHYVAHFTGLPVRYGSMLVQLPMYHLWFAYMIIGLYVLLPVLQAVFRVVQQRRDMQVYILVVWFVVTCVPTYQPLPVLGLMQQTSLLGYGGYFILGGLLAGPLRDRGATWMWAALYVGAVAVTFGLTWHHSARVGAAWEQAYVYMTPNVLVASVAAFALLTRLRLQGPWSVAMRWMSDLSFLVFLMHVVVLERVSNAMLAAAPGMPLLVMLPTIALVTFGLCLAIAAALRLIPGSRPVLG